MSEAQTKDPSIRVVTPSFRGDFERCDVLCASFDRFVGPGFDHQVIVPRRDLARFRELRGARREVLCAEEVLPGLALHLPGGKERWLLGLRYPRRGWLVQQLVKVAAARAADVDAVVFADSDIVFVRPVTAAHFLAEGRVRLFQLRGTDYQEIDPNFPKWYRGAAQLLGVPLDEPYPKSFVGPLASWTPALAAAMCERIERVTGRPWLEAVCRLQGGMGFSEYTTYGVFVERAEPAAAARHAEMPGRLCHFSWDHDMTTSSGREAFVRALRPEHVAVVVQSNLRLPTAEWRGLLDALPMASSRRAPAPDTP